MRHVRRLISGATLLMLLALAGYTSCAEGEGVKGPITEEGEIAGAPFRIDVPEGWKGGLIMYAHGYAVQGTVPAYNLMMVDVGKRLGYAVAQSRYTAQGWAAREGILDTEALRRHFGAKYGKTSPTIISGHSQGGAITFKTIELYPEAYDGALPLCGVAEPALMFFEERVFDMRVLFDYYFPGLPGSVVDFPEGNKTMAVVSAKAKELIEKNPEGAKKFIQMVNLPDAASIPGVIGFWSEILRELKEKTGASAFDNRDTVYGGSDDDAKLNREVPRYKGDGKSAEYLRQWVTITGQIHDPVVAMHTLVDQLIPIQNAGYYRHLTEIAGTSDRFVQLWVDRVGHCRFNADETAEALSRLDKWIREGKRPAPGDVTRNEPKKEAK